jgi:hypothetical protein
VKIFEPDGGTATPEAQQWLGIAMVVLSLPLLIMDFSEGPKLMIVSHLVLLLFGVYSIRSARQRKRKRR